MNPDSFGNVFRPRKPVHYLRQRKSIHMLLYMYLRLHPKTAGFFQKIEKKCYFSFFLNKEKNKQTNK